MHFFKNTISLLIEGGHEVVVTSREKECATELLDNLNVKHMTLSSEKGSGLLALLKELVVRDFKLLKLVRREKPDVMASIGGTFIAHVSFLTGRPSLVFYDTENAKLQNLITYPVATKVIVPQCYEAWLPKKKGARYSGYHELAYLHPSYFAPDRKIAEASGLAPEGETFFARVVAWNANHDIGENGWPESLLDDVVSDLSKRGKVIISSESALPQHLEQYRYKGRKEDVHHVMGFCRMFIGESATMASESAVLGVPAIYAAETGRGYTNEQESLYGLVVNVTELKTETLSSAIEKVLNESEESFRSKRDTLLNNTIDVTRHILDQIEEAAGAS